MEDESILLLKTARRIFSNIDEPGEMTLGQAIVWLFKNQIALEVGGNENEEELTKDWDICFESFKKEYPGIGDLAMQSVMALCISEETGADSNLVTALLFGTDCVAKRYRNYLQKKGMEFSFTQEEKGEIVQIRWSLTKMINKYRFDHVMKDKGFIEVPAHTKFAIKHSESMAEMGIHNTPDYLNDGSRKENIIMIPFKSEDVHARKVVAGRVFDEIIKHEDVLNPEYNGIAIGLWKEGNFLYVTLRYYVWNICG